MEFKGTSGNWEFDCDEYADTADVFNGKGETIIIYQGHNTERVYDFLLMSKSKEVLEMLQEMLRRISIVKSEPNGIVRESMINSLDIDILELIKQATEL